MFENEVFYWWFKIKQIKIGGKNVKIRIKLKMDIQMMGKA